MDTTQQAEDAVESARLAYLEKFSNQLITEVTLARQDGGFFDRKYWDDFIAAKVACQKESNKFYTILHELAK